MSVTTLVSSTIRAATMQRPMLDVTLGGSESTRPDTHRKYVPGASRCTIELHNGDTYAITCELDVLRELAEIPTHDELVRTLRALKAELVIHT